MEKLKIHCEEAVNGMFISGDFFDSEVVLDDKDKDVAEALGRAVNQTLKQVRKNAEATGEFFTGYTITIEATSYER